MRYVKIFLLPLFIILSVANAALCESKDTLVIGAVNVYPPHEYINHDGEPIGFSVELIERILSNNNIAYRTEKLSINNYKSSIINKKVDILVGICATQDRIKDLAFSNDYYNDNKIFITHKGNIIERLDHLNNKTIAVVKNACSYQFIKSIQKTHPFTVVVKENPEEVVKAVNNNECNYGYTSYITAKFLEKQLQLQEIKYSDTQSYKSKLRFACRKEDKQIIDLINQELKTLQAQKYIEYLENKWIIPTLAPNPNIIYSYIFAVASILIIIIVILGVFNTILHKRVSKKTEELETALKETEIAKQSAENSNKLKSVFLSNVSHDIRTPLNSICGFSNLLTDNDLTDDEKNRYKNIINTNSDQLINLVSDLIDISKIEADQLKIIYTNINLNDLIHDIYQKFELEKKRQGKHDIQLNYYCTLLNSLSIIISDKNRVNQILSNLLSNALKFTENGSISFGYTLIQENNKEYLKFYVKDTGIGIKEEDLNLIFDRFKQTRSNYTHLGTGLGLSICQRLAEILKGNICVNSIYGKGSEFYFTIPYDRPEIPNKLLNHQILLQYNWLKKSVIIIERQKHNKKFIESLLNPTGINKIAVNSGTEALEYIESNKKVDLVLIDLELPKTLGLEAIQKIKSNNPQIPIVAITPYASAEQTKIIRNSHCDDFVSMPQKEYKFYNILNIWLNKS